MYKDGKCKYGKMKYTIELGWKMQVQTLQVKSSTITHRLY